MTSNVVRLICPNLRCRSLLAVPESARGKMVRCRNCGSRVQVPGVPGGAGTRADADEPANAPTAEQGQPAG